jgi:predicted nucleic acid-binding Zn ribbon protein
MMAKKVAEGPQLLSDVIAKLVIARGWSRSAERAKIEAAWSDAVVSVSAEIDITQTRIVSLRRGILEIEVRMPVLLQELSQFHKRPLLAKLRERLPNLTINDLKFKTGVWSVAELKSAHL